MKKTKTVGYKAFGKGLVCKNKKYKIGKTFSHKGKLELCKSGLHFCLNPLDVLNYYDLTDSEFVIISAERVSTEKGGGDTKRVAKKITIEKKLKLGDFIDKAIKYVLDNCQDNNSSGYSARLASSGNGAQLASSGDSAQLASSGNDAKLASSGYSARLASSGYSAQLASSGYSARLASSGNGAQLASSGNSAQLTSSGDFTQLASSGYSARLASSGNSAQLASSGYSARLASSGNSARLEISGRDSVGANIGVGGITKAIKGSWITLAEYDDNNKIKCVKSVKVDGKKIKANKWYKLENGKFTLVEK